MRLFALNLNVRTALLWLPAGLLTAVTFSALLSCTYQAEKLGRYYVDSEFKKLAPAFPTETDPFLIRTDRSWAQLMNEIHEATNEIHEDSERIKAIKNIVASWFRHGLSQYQPCHNWSLYLLAQFPTIREKYPMGLLDPRDIVKSEYAFCSQNAIVLQEVIKEFGYEYASVGFGDPTGGGHFASAVRIDGTWYFLDANIANTRDSELFELRHITGKTPESERAIRTRYRDHTGIPELILASNQVGNTMLRDINRYPAPRGLLLQKVTKLFSGYGWLLALVLTFLYSRYSATKALRREIVNRAD